MYRTRSTPNACTCRRAILQFSDDVKHTTKITCQPKKEKKCLLCMYTHALQNYYSSVMHTPRYYDYCEYIIENVHKQIHENHIYIHYSATIILRRSLSSWYLDDSSGSCWVRNHGFTLYMYIPYILHYIKPNIYVHPIHTYRVAKTHRMP